MSGAMMTSRASMVRFLESFGERGEGRVGQQETRVAEDVLDVERAEVRDADAREVAARAFELLADACCLVGRVHDERLPAALRGARRAEQERAQVAGLAEVEVFGRKHRHAIVLEAVGERGLKRDVTFLLIERRFVAARLGTEDDAAVRPLRRANRTLTRAAGALLAPRLPAAAAHFVTAQRRRGTGALVGELAKDGTEHRVALAAEVGSEGRGDGFVAHGRAGRVDDGRHYFSAFAALRGCFGGRTAAETRTSPLRAPGTGPRTRSTVRSVSARMTSRF